MDDIAKTLPVLVVDDDETQRAVITTILQRIGFETIDEAGDGTEALAKVQQTPPRLIVCDVHMKPMDGLTFVTKLRFGDDQALREVPVIMVTVEKRGAAITVANKLNIAAYIVKPTSSYELKAAAESALGFELP